MNMHSILCVLSIILVFLSSAHAEIYAYPSAEYLIYQSDLIFIGFVAEIDQASDALISRAQRRPFTVNCKKVLLGNESYEGDVIPY